MVLMYYAGDYYQIAVRAGYQDAVASRNHRANRMPAVPDARSDRAFCPGDGPLIAVVFASMALEAFINEAAHATLLTLTEPDLKEPNPPRGIELFGHILTAVEECHGSLQQKYRWAHRALRGQPYNAGAQPYQDFETLALLRNDLVHLKVPSYRVSPNDPSLIYADILKRLEQRNVLLDPTLEWEPDEEDLQTPGQFLTPLFSALATVAVARWACNTAACVVTDLVSAMPESRCKDMLPHRAFKNVA